jgi:Nif-specific regulatory protein
VVLSESDTIRVCDLPMVLQNYRFEGHGPIGVNGGPSGGHTLEDIEKQMLYEALRATGFNHTRAASKLGITRRTLGYRIEKYGLPRRADQDPTHTGKGGQSS